MYNKSKILEQKFSLIFLSIALIFIIFNKTNVNFNNEVSFSLNNSILDIYKSLGNISYKYQKILKKRKYIKKLEKENSLLNDKYHKLLAEQTLNKITLKENADLKNVLQIKNASSYNIYPFKIYTRNLNYNNSYLTIDLRESYVKPKVGDAVLSTNGFVGFITEITKDNAKVTLIYSNLSKISVYTASSNLNAIVIGNGTKNLNIKSYDKNTAIPFIENELVYTSGLEKLFPSNIPVGVVKKIDNKLIVKPLSNLYRINYVYVVVK